MNIIDEIKRAMKENDISQRELANITQIGERRISDYLTGTRKNPTLKTLTKMCNALNLEITVKARVVI